jgi:hypothetical protein
MEVQLQILWTHTYKLRTIMMIIIIIINLIGPRGTESWFRHLA